MLSGALIGAALGVLVSGASLLWDARRAPPPAAPSPVVTVPVEAPRRAMDATITLPVVAATPTPAPRSVQAPASASVPAPPVEPRAEPGAARPSTTGSPADPAPADPGAAAPPGDVETEAHLLERAHQALGASPAQALALTEEHAGRFPSGSLGQEREVVAIQALMRLGRVEEARARAARFVAAFPGSAHRSRIEALVAP
jgi:hypothetical protein